MRLRAVKNASERLASFSDFVVFEPANHRGNWQNVFKNNQPIFVEIGMGKGKFLSELASIHQDINFIGIEKYSSVIVKAAEKIAEQKLPNIRMVNMDANEIDTIFMDGEIAKIYLNFSDPWPKTRHAKRRLTSPLFLEQFKKVLTNDGEIELKTDNPKLFEYSIMSFWDNRWQILDCSVDLHRRDIEIVTTEYEERFLALNQPIYYLKVKRKCNS